MLAVSGHASVNQSLRGFARQSDFCTTSAKIRAGPFGLGNDPRLWLSAIKTGGVMSAW
jgi:hypothetical protein